MQRRTLFKKAINDLIDVEGLRNSFGEEITYSCLQKVYNPRYTKETKEQFVESTELTWQLLKERLFGYGIEVKEWGEDFIDETTGEVITVDLIEWKTRYR